MTQNTADPRTLGISSLAHRCERETERFFKREDYDPTYCYELFRRAIVAGDQSAHERLFVQYQSLVASWVERHPSYGGANEEVQYFVNRAFEKLWRALTPAKFSRFADLKSLLAYLKMCTHSAIIDHARSQQAAADEEPGLEQLADSHGAGGNLEEDAVRDASRAEFWRLIDERVGGDKERAVIYGSYVLAMKPGELLVHYSHLFSDVKDVYRTKQNIIERLRRDPGLLAFVSADA